jgi:hypothetical protein
LFDTVIFGDSKSISKPGSGSLVTPCHSVREEIARRGGHAEGEGLTIGHSSSEGHGS